MEILEGWYFYPLASWAKCRIAFILFFISTVFTPPAAVVVFPYEGTIMSKSPTHGRAGKAGDRKILRSHPDTARQKSTGKGNWTPADRIVLPSREEVKNRKQALSALLDSIQDEVWFADKTGNFVLVNRSGLQEFSSTIGEEKRVEKIAASLEVHRPDGTPRPVDEAPPLRALRGETIIKQEEIVRTPATGELRHRQVNAAPVKDDEGNIIGSIAVVRDITEQKQTEARLRNSLDALTRIHKLSEKLLDRRGLHPLLQEILDAAVEITAADKGTLQLLEGDSLRIVAHHGHDKSFLEFFERAENVASVCGETTRRGERVIVSDVEESPIFAGMPSLQVLRNAGVLAVQSTPIRNRKGVLLGILTTHWSVRHSLDEHDLWKLDLLVRQAADLIEVARTEEELKENEERFRALVTASSDVTYRMSPDWSEMWQLQRREFIPDMNNSSRTWLDRYIHPDDQPRVLGVINEALRAKGILELEHRVIRIDGTLGWVFSRAVPLLDANGQIAEWFGTAKDITERKRAKEALHELNAELELRVSRRTSELSKANEKIQAERQRLFDVLETVPVMICLLTQDYHVAFANRSFRAKFGESNGRHCYEYCYGREKPCEFCESYKVLQTGQPHHWEVVGLADSVIEAHDYPFTDVDDSPMILEMDIDITKNRRAETALREVGAYNRTLIEASPDPLVTIGPDGRITDVNAATEHATGRNRMELVNTDFSEYFTEPDKAKAGYQQVFREGTVRNYPLEIRHRDGHTTPVLYNATVYRNAEGKIIGVFAAARDISDLIQAQQELRQAHEGLAMRAAQLRALASELTLVEQRERSRLANLLHDHLQQLLVAAKFRLTVLGRGTDEVTKLASKEVEELIDESIASSRSLTAELSPPILHEAGLKEGLQWLARRMADTQGLFVDLELNEIETLAEDLKIMLYQSIRELLFNVVKHAKTRSAVVNLRQLDGCLQVTVSDQGSGFDPANMPAPGEAGKGFGLFSIRERLELMGGTLEIQSKPGHGSRFVLSLPIASAKALEPESHPIPVSPEIPLMASQHPETGRKIRVMLVDDHAVVRQGIANLLADESDIEVIGEAADGQAAVALAAKLVPDVILMDLNMPRLNGVEATRIIHNEWPETRIIGLSMFEEADRAMAMRDAGAVDYLTKSGPAETLIRAIRTSIQISAKIKTLSMKA